MEGAEAEARQLGEREGGERGKGGLSVNKVWDGRADG